MVVNFSGMPSASSIFTAYASLSALVMLIQTMLNQLMPRQFQHYIWSFIQNYLRTLPSNAAIIIEERDGMSSNEVYNAAEIYLSTKIRENIDRLKVSKRHKDNNLTVKFAQCEKIVDFFEGIELEWRFVYEEKKKSSKVIDEDSDNLLFMAEKKYFELCFNKKHKNKVLDVYVPFMLEKAKSIRAENKVVKLHTLASSVSYSSSILWDSINLQHPSTFDTLAIETNIKKAIIDDLDRFVRRKEFYKKVGKAWKRGYLLYGPPGTGKSSLIAAMANYLKFDIYDLELTNVKRDSDLRKLLLRTANRSILVIEDIDCSVELPDRKELMCADGHGRPHDLKFTLSGLLNFIDGLWSSCGDERIIVFTTNKREKLDPALLRPGRMDMHIHMSYLTPDGFKLLASTYLGIQGHHPLFDEIGESIQSMKITPAEVAEELMKSDDPDTSLQGLVNFLNCKRIETDLSKIKGKEENEVHNVKGLASDDSDIEAVTD
ncbi:P-loop containing nucleoside triphosphate hydrolase superfamily protein [Forsythia ovata]|uniref:P-loop containing nucleoside triphosphate hydrolase superfamily protein n=1 Tax=Forsythia ovata TaxID=205694 RepID=A0ABD1U6C3_9LAMI